MRLKKCSYTDRYKAEAPPTCDGGYGCVACSNKWNEVQNRKHRRGRSETDAGDKLLDGRDEQ